MENSNSSQFSEQPEDAWDSAPVHSPFSRILVAVDGSDASTEACRTAVRVAAVHGLTVTVLYVIENKAVEELAAASGDSRESVGRQLEAKGKRYLAHAASIAGEYGVACTRMARRGIPHSRITDVAREIGADLIVIGDRRLRGARRALSGSLIELVIEYAPCSVLVVRPS